MRLAPDKRHLGNAERLRRARLSILARKQEAARLYRDVRALSAANNEKQRTIDETKRVMLATAFKPSLRGHGDDLVNHLVRKAIEKAQIVHGQCMASGDYEFHISIPELHVRWLVSKHDIQDRPLSGVSKDMSFTQVNA